MTRWFLLGSFLCVVCFLGGCEPSKPKPITVSGTVNLDGKPLPDGSISLIGTAGEVPVSIPIKEGKFEGQATPGKKRVEIRADRMGKPTKMGDVVIEATPENYLPERFNSQSTLTAEVSASGINPNTYEVQSK
jgi:hypothetical protein